MLETEKEKVLERTNRFKPVLSLSLVPAFPGRQMQGRLLVLVLVVHVRVHVQQGDDHLVEPLLSGDVERRIVVAIAGLKQSSTSRVGQEDLHKSKHISNSVFVTMTIFERLIKSFEGLQCL